MKKVRLSTPNIQTVPKLAERGGFEPPIEKIPITDFESAAFDHSATLPYSQHFCPNAYAHNRFARFARSPFGRLRVATYQPLCPFQKECWDFTIFSVKNQGNYLLTSPNNGRIFTT